MPHTHQDHKTCLTKHRAVITEWNGYSVQTQINQPPGAQPVCGMKTVKCAGFFTPFTEEHMGLTPSLKGLVLMPLLKLHATATHLLNIPLNLFMAFERGIKGDVQGSRLRFNDVFFSCYNALHSFCAFLLEMVKSIVSPLTRTFATVLTMAPEWISCAQRSAPDGTYYHIHRDDEAAPSSVTRIA